MRRADMCPAGADGDIAVISGVLQTANSIFKRYRDQYRSNALVSELAATQVCSSEIAWWELVVL